ncbi:MAG: hypothetical protein VCA73_20445 [Roseibacillus sp.]
MGEQNNLITSNLKKAAELESLWRTWNKDNAAPLWQPANLEKLRRLYGNEGMKVIEP